MLRKQIGLFGKRGFLGGNGVGGGVDVGDAGFQGGGGAGTDGFEGVEEGGSRVGGLLGWEGFFW